MLVDFLLILEQNISNPGMPSVNLTSLGEKNKMSKRMYPPDVLEQARSVQEGWSQIDENLAFGNLNLGELVTGINQIRVVENSVERLEKQLTEMRNQRDSLYLTTWDRVKRARASIKGLYGDDSTQYELVGGTRLSERKSVRRTAPPVQ